MLRTKKPDCMRISILGRLLLLGLGIQLLASAICCQAFGQVPPARQATLGADTAKVTVPVVVVAENPDEFYPVTSSIFGILLALFLALPGGIATVGTIAQSNPRLGRSLQMKPYSVKWFRNLTVYQLMAAGMLLILLLIGYSIIDLYIGMPLGPNVQLVAVQGALVATLVVVVHVVGSIMGYKRK